MKERAVSAFVALCLIPAASIAADRPIGAPQLYYPPAPSIPPQRVEWTGLYFGANAGYGWARQSSTTVFEGDFPGGTTTLQGRGATELSGTTVVGSGALDGAIAGGQIGFNWQAGMIVFGAELDAQWSGQQGAFAANCGAGCTATESIQIRSIITGRARVGLAFDWFMPYLTAGAALVNARDDLTMTVGGVTAAFQPPLSNTQLGWTAGAGVEVALWSNWSAKLEYLYIAAEDLASETRIPNALGVGDALQSAAYRDNIVRVGLNYRFGPRGGPGVLERAPPPTAYALNYDFLPSAASIPQIASVKRPAVAPTLAAPDIQFAGPVSTESKQKEPTEEIGSKGAESEERETKERASKGTKTASAIPYYFADVGDIEDDAVARPVAPKLLKSSPKQQETLEEESRRLKRIMSICSGC